MTCPCRLYHDMEGVVAALESGVKLVERLKEVAETSTCVSPTLLAAIKAWLSENQEILEDAKEILENIS